jgi:hypothetical protein
MNLSLAIVKNKTFWTQTGHVKGTFSLLFERISNKIMMSKLAMLNIKLFIWSTVGHRRMGHGFRFLLPPFSLLPPFFLNFHINHSYFKNFIIIRFFFRYCQMKKKRMIMKILNKEWLIWKFWKKGGGSREKGGGGSKIHAPCTCAVG